MEEETEANSIQFLNAELRHVVKGLITENLKFHGTKPGLQDLAHMNIHTTQACLRQSWSLPLALASLLISREKERDHKRDVNKFEHLSVQKESRGGFGDRGPSQYQVGGRNARERMVGQNLLQIV